MLIQLCTRRIPVPVAILLIHKFAMVDPRRQTLPTRPSNLQIYELRLEFGLVTEIVVRCPQIIRVD